MGLAQVDQPLRYGLRLVIHTDGPRKGPQASHLIKPASNRRRGMVVHLNPEKADKKARDEADNPIEERTAVNPPMRQVA